MNRRMILDNFVRTLERYGGDLERWPKEWRSRAEALLAASPAAVGALERARAFERALHAGDPAADIDAERCAAIRRRVFAAISKADRQQAGRRMRWWQLGPFEAPFRLTVVRFAATALTAAALGVLAGQGLNQLADVRSPAVVADVSSAQAAGGLAALFRQPHMTTAALQ